MKTLRGVFTTTAMTIALTAFGVSQSPAANFDGDWSVLIQTAQGKCGSYRAALRIISGKVLSAQGDYAVSGTVSPNGVTAVTVISNQGSATGTGRLQGSTGTGKWRSMSGECSGTWSATRH